MTLCLQAPAISPLNVTNRSRPFFSVVIVVYAHAARLRDLLFSLQTQSLNHPHLEIIILDNLTDTNASETVQQLRDTVSTFLPIQYFKLKTVHTVAESYNAAFAQASGQWIQVLTENDFVSPTFYSEFYAALSSPLYDTVGGAYCKAIQVENRMLIGQTSVTPDFTGIHFKFYQRLLVEPLPFYAGWLFKRAALEAVGGCYSQLTCDAETELYFRLANTFPILFIQMPRFIYRLPKPVDPAQQWLHHVEQIKSQLLIYLFQLHYTHDEQYERVRNYLETTVFSLFFERLFLVKAECSESHRQAVSMLEKMMIAIYKGVKKQGELPVESWINQLSQWQLVRA